MDWSRAWRWPRSWRAAWRPAPISSASSAPAVRSVPVLLPLLVALYPKVTYSDQLAWTEPLLVALLTGMVLAARRGRTGVAVLCLALALASKQHIFLLLPLTAIWPRFGLRRTLVAAGSALLLVTPWIIAGPRDFWHDAIDANVGLGYRADALCISTWVHKTLGYDPGFALTALGLLIAYVLAWRIRGDAFGFCAGAGGAGARARHHQHAVLFQPLHLGDGIGCTGSGARAGPSVIGAGSAFGGKADQLRRLQQARRLTSTTGVAAERCQLVGRLRAVVAQRAVAVGAYQVDGAVRSGEGVPTGGRRPSGWPSACGPRNRPS